MSATAYPLVRAAAFGDLSPSIHWAQQHQRTPQFQWNRRIYDFELLYVMQGEFIAEMKDHRYFVPAGSLLFLPSGVPHRIEILTDPYVKLLGIHFDFFDELEVKRDEDIIVDEQQVVEERFCALPVFDGISLFSVPDVIVPPPQIVSLMEFIIHEWNERKLGYEIACKGLMLQILSLLLRSQEEKSRVIHPKYEQRLLALVHELETNYRKKWTAAEMAKFLNVHEDYMSKLFKDMMGMNPNQYLQSIRHQEAKRLLRETDYKIETIANEVGYGDLHYFSRVFKKREGMSALQYRRWSQLF